MNCDFKCEAVCERCGHRHGEHLATDLFSDDSPIYPAKCWGNQGVPCEVDCSEFVPVQA